MVRALLDGRKTQTRRLATSPCAAWEPGDRLYVREAWRTHKEREDLKPSWLEQGRDRIWFEADRDNCDAHGRLRPGIHMPRWASRLTLILRDVTVSPLQSISDFDAEAEGVEKIGYPSVWKHYSCTMRVCVSPRASFETLWDSLHGTKAGERWADNPDVVALTFEVAPGNVDQLGEFE
jgi:hypothetical protein